MVEYSKPMDDDEFFFDDKLYEHVEAGRVKTRCKDCIGQFAVNR
jgi:hypothetical protein